MSTTHRLEEFCFCDPDSYGNSIVEQRESNRSAIGKEYQHRNSTRQVAVAESVASSKRGVGSGSSGCSISRGSGSSSTM